ncbi:GH32 C-terminal domain-containing protein [Microbacterium sp. KNMS]
MTSTAISTETTSLRPSAHFTAQRSWLNDPNGLLFHDGVYHLFFQTNPAGSTWGNISWGHATSSDLVTWTEREIAIPATEHEMAFSGSAVVDVRNTAGFAGEGQTALVAIYTAASHPDQHPATQAQSLAYSVDGGETWTRYAGNPVLDIGSSEFRDPKVFWYGEDDGHWVMAVVAATEHRVLFYTSPDLLTWTAASHFGPAHAVGGVWECPDLFPLAVDGTDETRWVLVVSLNPGGIAGGSGTQYFIGNFDGAEFVAERVVESDELADYDWIDYGHDYYAAVSFANVPNGRRLMIGWASNWLYANETPTSPWRSAMSLVRDVRLVRRSDGTLALAQTPVLPPEPSALQVHAVSAPRQRGAVTTVTLSNDAGERFVITVDIDAGTLRCDRRAAGRGDFHPDYSAVAEAPLLRGGSGDVDLQIVVDATVVEVFAEGGTVSLTEQVFPTVPFSRIDIDHDRPDPSSRPTPMRP